MLIENQFLFQTVKVLNSDHVEVNHVTNSLNVVEQVNGLNLIIVRSTKHV